MGNVGSVRESQIARRAGSLACCFSRRSSALVTGGEPSPNHRSAIAERYCAGVVPDSSARLSISA